MCWLGVDLHFHACANVHPMHFRADHSEIAARSTSAENCVLNFEAPTRCASQRHVTHNCPSNVILGLMFKMHYARHLPLDSHTGITGTKARRQLAPQIRYSEHLKNGVFDSAQHSQTISSILCRTSNSATPASSTATRARTSRTQPPTPIHRGAPTPNTPTFPRVHPRARAPHAAASRNT